MNPQLIRRTFGCFCCLPITGGHVSHCFKLVFLFANYKAKGHENAATSQLSRFCFDKSIPRKMPFFFTNAVLVSLPGADPLPLL